MKERKRRRACANFQTQANEREDVKRKAILYFPLVQFWGFCCTLMWPKTQNITRSRRSFTTSNPKEQRETYKCAYDGPNQMHAIASTSLSVTWRDRRVADDGIAATTIGSEGHFRGRGVTFQTVREMVPALPAAESRRTGIHPCTVAGVQKSIRLKGLRSQRDGVMMEHLRLSHSCPR